MLISLDTHNATYDDYWPMDVNKKVLAPKK